MHTDRLCDAVPPAAAAAAGLRAAVAVHGWTRRALTGDSRRTDGRLIHMDKSPCWDSHFARAPVWSEVWPLLWVSDLGLET